MRVTTNPVPQPADALLTVLIVEPDLGDAFLIQELLEEARSPFRSVVVRTVAEALVAPDSVDCVILALPAEDAPGMTGVQLLTDRPNPPPLVVVVGFDDDHLGEVALASGAADYLVKGQIDGVLLARTLRAAGSIHRERRRVAELQAELHGARQAAADRRAALTPRSFGRLPDARTSTAVVIGTSAYRSPDLHDLPAVANNVVEVADTLADEGIGGFARDRVHVLRNPEDAVGDLGERLADLAADTTDVLLVYYAGHGLVDLKGELYLSLPGTTPGRARYNALPYEWIRNVFQDSPAAARVLLLDCCFSGRAIETMTHAAATLVSELEASGVYTLTATSPNRLAIAPVGARFTAFTGELLDLLQHGDPAEGPLLRITSMFEPLTRSLAAKGFPRPHQRGTGTIGSLALVRNRRAGA